MDALGGGSEGGLFLRRSVVEGVSPESKTSRTEDVEACRGYVGVAEGGGDGGAFREWPVIHEEVEGMLQCISTALDPR